MQKQKYFYHATLFTEYTKTDFPFRAIHYFLLKFTWLFLFFLSRSVIGPWEELIQKHNLPTLKGFDDVFIPQRHTDWCFNKTKVCIHVIIRVFVSISTPNTISCLDISFLCCVWTDLIHSAYRVQQLMTSVYYTVVSWYLFSSPDLNTAVYGQRRWWNGIQ